MSGTLAALSGADPGATNSPVGQQMLGAAAAGTPPNQNLANADAKGAQARASLPAGGTPPEVPARQIMSPATQLALMGASMGKHARKR